MTRNVKVKAQPPAKHRARDPWFPDGFYSMQSDPMLEALAASENLTPQARVLLLAQARMNRWGHAAFQEGELFARIGKKDRRTVVTAIDAFKQAGLFSPDSSPLCIALSARAYRRNAGTSQRCIEPKHFSKQERMWVDQDFGWEEHPGQWHEYLIDTERKAAIASGELTGWTASAREIERETVIRETVREVNFTPASQSGDCTRHGEPAPCWKCAQGREDPFDSWGA